MARSYMALGFGLTTDKFGPSPAAVSRAMSANRARPDSALSQKGS